MAEHALLSPSAAHRWMNCTAAPKLEAGVKDESSTYALEGTLAHAYCDKKLKELLGLDFGNADMTIAMLEEEYHTGEMDEHTDTYAAIVMEKWNAALRKTRDARLLVEQRLSFGDYIPNSFGTADAIIMADGLMEVIDFKYGKGVSVDARENPQMMIYALGAYARFSFEYDIHRVRMTIVQPRIGNLSEYEVSVEELQRWAAEKLMPAAKEATETDGRQSPGDWCRFCKVRGNCRALADKCKAATAHDPRTLTADEIGSDILPLLPTVKAWLSDVEDYAMQQALSGVRFPGWKLVEGRSIRKITDAQGAGKVLEGMGYQPADIYRPTELRTLTDLERLVGKKSLTVALEGYIDKPKGKPTLVAESDKREAIDPVAEDFKDIN